MKYTSLPNIVVRIANREGTGQNGYRQIHHNSRVKEPVQIHSSSPHVIIVVLTAPFIFAIKHVLVRSYHA